MRSRRLLPTTTTHLQLLLQSLLELPSLQAQAVLFSHLLSDLEALLLVRLVVVLINACIYVQKIFFKL
jgi:hypothetical protein